MRNYIYRFFLLLLPLLGLESCNDEFSEGGLSLEGTLPVAFNFEEPEDILGTRGVEDYKKLFEEGDVIHVQGTFTAKDGSSATSYGALVLTGRKWVPVVESTLYWPLEAEKGEFKAFYIPGSDNVLSKGTSTPSVNLADVADGEDPLEAAPVEVPYGYAVDMQFYHACTYLTLEKMEPNATDYFWMVFPGSNGPIKNAYQLTLSRGGELSLNFISVPDRTREDLVYISRPSESQTIDGKLYSKASYYLAPGNYSYFDLRTNNNYPFMTFLNSLTMPLEANHPYTLNVENAKGANFNSTTEVDWDNKTGGWEVNVPEFLKAVANGTEYSEVDEYGNEVPILKKANGTLLLQTNLDFNFYDDYGYETLGFFPDVTNSTIFDGNLHYIENVGYPLFRFNAGTIQNLGIKNFRAEVYAYQGTNINNYASDNSRIGALCNWNRTDARIYNIRMEGIDLTVNLQAQDPEQTTSNDNFSIGGVCGDNYSSISEIALKGAINITVQADAAGGFPDVDANVNIGGILGNHTAYLSNVGPLPGETFTVTINNTCKGRPQWGSGVFCVGGAVGQSTANEITQVVVNNVIVNATESDGYQQYTGGLAGRLRGDGYIVSDCTVQGTLTCGVVTSYGSFTSPFSYMGGIAGNVRGYTVSNCRAVCNVNSNTTSIADDATYATGGAFGRIQSNCTIINNSAYGNQLSGPDNYIGTFAGIANDSYQWDDLRTAGNTSRQILQYSAIGAYINDID